MLDDGGPQFPEVRGPAPVVDVEPVRLGPDGDDLGADPRVNASGETPAAAPCASSRTTFSPSSRLGRTESRCATYRSKPSSYDRMRPTPAPVGRSQGAPVRCSSYTPSIRSSRSSASLWPPRAKNLMPLSGMALWLAESITPRSAPSSPVRNATAGVGSTPTLSTSTPALARLTTTAASRNSPDARGSRPTTATGLWPSNVPASASTCAAATESPSASSAVRSALATPRTPSVPKSRPTVVSSELLRMCGSYLMVPYRAVPHRVSPSVPAFPGPSTSPETVLPLSGLYRQSVYKPVINDRPCYANRPGGTGTCHRGDARDAAQARFSACCTAEPYGPS